jgi:RNA polymerase sigma-70 factor (ECF subfamily)
MLQMAEVATMMPPALDDLYVRHNRMVFGAAYRVTGSVADAEDVLHTVFLRVLKGAVPSSNAEGYLRRAAVNAALDVVRARRSSSDMELDRLTSGVRDGLDEVRDSELRGQLREALATLPERAAEIFVMRHFEGYKNPEIARMLGITQIGVAVTLHRARKKLQEELRRVGVRS